ncbi:MAG: hypothetical protein ACRD3C_17630 [Vicinamibacterales bacterium]
MNRHVHGIFGAALLSGAVIAIVPASERALVATADAQDRLHRDSQVTYIGCVLRERDYRRQNGDRTGGYSNTGWGLGNEYMLINAAPADSAGPENDCKAGSTGEVIELKGPRESDLVGMIGTRVEVNGRWSGARLESDGSYETRGGFDNFGGELQLREIKVHFFRPMPVPPPAPVAVVIVPEPPPAPTTGALEELAEAEEEVAEAEEELAQEIERLPQTASPLPLMGLVGLFSLAGAFGVRRLRRR